MRLLWVVSDRARRRRVTGLVGFVAAVVVVVGGCGDGDQVAPAPAASSAAGSAELELEATSGGAVYGAEDDGVLAAGCVSTPQRDATDAVSAIDIATCVWSYVTDGGLDGFATGEEVVQAAILELTEAERHGGYAPQRLSANSSGAAMRAPAPGAGQVGIWVAEDVRTAVFVAADDTGTYHVRWDADAINNPIVTLDGRELSSMEILDLVAPEIAKQQREAVAEIGRAALNVAREMAAEDDGTIGSEEPEDRTGALVDTLTSHSDVLGYAIVPLRGRTLADARSPRNAPALDTIGVWVSTDGTRALAVTRSRGGVLHAWFLRGGIPRARPVRLD